MKEIKAVIQPNRLTRLRDAFREVPNFPGMTISKVQGCRQHRGIERHDTVKDELTDFSDKIRIEILAEDGMVDEIIRVIHASTHTGQTGDGLVWVTDVLTLQRLCHPTQ